MVPASKHVVGRQGHHKCIEVAHSVCKHAIEVGLVNKIRLAYRYYVYIRQLGHKDYRLVHLQKQAIES